MARSKPFPASVDPAFPKLQALPTGWTRTTFGEVVEPVERRLILDPGRIYKLVTAKRSRGGIVLRDELKGAEILTKTQFEVHAGDFLISRRQIIHGACGIVSDDLHGAAVSNEYSVLRPRASLHLEFLRHFSHTPYFQRTCFHSSHGVDIEKMVFKLDRWLAWPINLPPLEEQRRISAILASVNDVIAKAQAVIEQLQVVKKALVAELLRGGLPGRHQRHQSSAFGPVPVSWLLRPFGSVTRQVRNPVLVEQNGSYREIGVRSHGRGVFHKDSIRGSSLGSKKVFWVQANCLVFNIVFAWEGAVATTSEAENGMIASHRFPMFEPAKEILDLQYLRLLMQTPIATEILATLSPGGAGRNRTLNQGRLREIEIPLPPIREQLGISNAICSVERRLSDEIELLDAQKALRDALSGVLLSGERRANLGPKVV